MEYTKLCESDYRFLSVIWEAEPVSSTRLAKLCEEKLGWKKSTTYTMLKKMTEKGLAKNENTIVTAVVPREQVQACESRYFVEQTFDGSLPGFLASFFDGRTITDAEAAELVRLIESHRGHGENKHD